ncbi:GNAT family N-acetyltransferase [Methylocapsa palsarum]|uniref:Predicted N-acetyltransferase YhbS n=1 Tax=Methylocapsa palsarum TaxID=1612308 RepID=A0A1I4A8S8_9HYPH|nr:N-acetyltransferase [Methylocapsa palsarum]SFK52206.1 Predicted N-acetyltransferase YhbS [Methylocapsa palsarum]
MTLTLNNGANGAAVFGGRFGERAIEILDEAPSDVFAREALLDAAFGASRFRKTAERLRRGRLPARGLAFAAKDAGALVGTVRLWSIEAGDVPALLLGPIAVAQTHRSRGIGRRLMAESLFHACVGGHSAVLLVGDAPYYEAFGFSRRHTLQLSLPGPVDEARFLGLELRSGSLAQAKGLVRPTGAIDLNEFRRAA